MTHVGLWRFCAWISVVSPRLATPGVVTEGVALFVASKTDDLSRRPHSKVMTFFQWSFYTHYRHHSHPLQSTFPGHVNVKVSVRPMFLSVAALHQGAPGQITCLEDPPPCSSPGSSRAYCFASVIVWTENKNVTISDRFICFILTVKRRWRPVSWGRQLKKSHQLF